MPTRLRRRRQSLGALLLVMLATLLGSPVLVVGQGSGATAPVPVGEETAAGPLRVRVLEVVTGQAATDLVVAADPTNSPPRDGITYVAANLRVRNTGERPVLLDNDDFAIVGASGIVRRFVGAQPPAPALDGPLDPGAARDGWVVLSAPTDETGLLLIFDSLALPGAWADRVLALDEGADLPAAPGPVEPNDAGADPAIPAGVGEPVVTADWGVELLDVAQGAAVFELVDYRTAALGIDDAVGADLDGTVWVALRIRVTNVGGDAGEGGVATHLPANAFALADAAGVPILDALVLTPPRPDAAGPYALGASRDGWVAFDVVPGGAYTVRFLPYPTLADDRDPRYLALPPIG